MKKLVAFMGLLTLGLGSAMAQDAEPKNGVGVDVDYNSKVKNVGFGVKYQHKIGRKKRLVFEPAFHFFIPKDGVKTLDVSANWHWNFNIGDKFIIYPAVGVGLAHGTVGVGLVDAVGDHNEHNEVGKDPGDYSGGASNKDSEVSKSSSTKFTWNVGAGIQYNFSDKWAGTLEVKNQVIAGTSQVVAGVGVLYRF